ncbi:N-acetylmuramoyl-L-alanine amidase [Jannaschia sp. KMU-145]|uniref:N-acetylmuramoyl-L-alanine amidase n=1 Tax=Jannaschia halovivens TaxID=3388667 RepID=UPI00396AFA12
MTVVDRPSPNHGPRRDGRTRPDLVMIHYTAMQGGPEPALTRLCLPEAEVSAHYLIGECGTVFRLVEEMARAWHAGAGCWGASSDLNSRSVGIELSNDGFSPFPAAQMDALEDLVGDICRRHGIGPAGLIGHSDAAPGRKIDPGRRFDWRRLARRGLAVWPDAEPGDAPDAAGFRALAQMAGYTADVDDGTLLGAVRLRFRPWASGPLDRVDMGLIADLAARFPVDAGEAAV